MKIASIAVSLVSAAVLSSCATMSSEHNAAPGEKPEEPIQLNQSARDHHAFVQAACGGCHAVDPPGLSPNPQAPTFESIANRPGLSEDTLAAWLSDAHNYPEVMDFDLDPSHIDWIAEHMMSLQRDDYTPPPS